MSADIRPTPSPLKKKKTPKLTCLSTIRDPFKGVWYKFGQDYEVEVVSESWLDSQVKAGLFKITE